MRRVAPLLPLLLLATAGNPPGPGRETTAKGTESEGPSYPLAGE